MKAALIAALLVVAITASTAFGARSHAPTNGTLDLCLTNPVVGTSETKGGTPRTVYQAPCGSGETEVTVVTTNP